MASLNAYELVFQSEEASSCVEVVFAASHEDAIDKWVKANPDCREVEDVRSCHHRALFDEYAPGPVPLTATLDAGWRYCCSGCELFFSAEGVESDVESEASEYAPVEDAKGNAYCSCGCMMRDWQESQQRKAAQYAMIEVGFTYWPTAVKITAIRRSRTSVGVDGCEITLPELRYPIGWSPVDQFVLVAAADQAVFAKHYYGQIAKC